MGVINCKYCGTPKELTSQNKYHQFCNNNCYCLYRRENKPTKSEYIHRIPTGKFPMFV